MDRLHQLRTQAMDNFHRVKGLIRRSNSAWHKDWLREYARIYFDQHRFYSQELRKLEREN